MRQLGELPPFHSPSMSDSVIQVENLGKKYLLGQQQGDSRYVALRDVIADGAKSLGRRLRQPLKPNVRPQHNEFWALRDVSFEVKQGEVVGIIGRNGAGKSTLLKVLSRITEPTTGRVRLRGRVASLLEVGTGFHPELTGRENIFLNGAILGMSRAEINRRFDEIVEFAEVSRFLDTPVKRYSSGMYVRLAFSVAAHLEPDILIIDEVLAVGDLGFQKKCLGKMQEVSNGGRTVIFVSHNNQAIRNLCTRSILIDGGKILANSSVEETLAVYNKNLRSFNFGEQGNVENHVNRRGSGKVRFSQISLINADGQQDYLHKMNDSVFFKLTYNVFSEIRDLYVTVSLRSGISGEIITSTKHIVSSNQLHSGEVGCIYIEWPEIKIRPGEYPLYFWLGDSEANPFDVVDDLTPPLVVQFNENSPDPHLNPSSPIGCFSINSRVLRLSSSLAAD